MAFDIGEARIEIKVALEELRENLKQAQAEVNQAIEQTKKDINLDVKLNGSTFDNISSGFKQIKNDVETFEGESVRSFGVVNDVIKEASNSIFGYGTVTSKAVSEGSAAFIAMGGAASSMAAPIALIIAGVAALAVEIYALIKFIGDVIEQTKNYISSNADLMKAIDAVKDAAKVLYDGFIKIYDALRDRIAGAIFDFIKSLVDTWNEMNRTTGAGDNLLTALKNLMSSGFEAVMRVVDAVIKIFSSFSGASDDSKQKVDSLTTMVQSLANVLNGVAWVIDKVALGIQIMGNWASGAVAKLQPVINAINDILNGIAKIANSGLGSIFGKGGLIGEGSDNLFQTGKEVRGEQNYKDYGVEMGPGNLEGKNQRNLYLNKQQSGSSSTGGTKEKEIDLEKEEKKLLDEIIASFEYQLRIQQELIEKGEAQKDSLVEIYQLYQDSLALKQNELAYQSNIDDVILRQLELQNEIKKINDEKLKGEQNIQSALEQNFQRQAEATQKLKLLDLQAEEEMKKLKLLNEGDIENIKLFDINARYDAEEKRIKETYLDSSNRERLLAELKIAKQKEVEKVNLESSKIITAALSSGFGSVISEISSGFSMAWNRIFGEANSLFEILIKNIYEQLIQLAASAIFKKIISVLTSGGGGFFSWLGSLFGEGGYTGKGDDDDVAGIVHRNEFVVSSKGTSIAENLGLLELMNQGTNVARMMQDRAAGFQIRNSIPDFSGLNLSGQKVTGDNIINLGGINGINIKHESLSGLDDTQWSRIVDDEIIPQVSRGLKRIGKAVLDNQIIK